jgi:hypothetical protein
VRSALVLGVVFVMVTAFSAAADFTLVRTIPSPDTDLTGLDNADGVLFAVAMHETGESCMFLIDPSNGQVLDVECLTQEPPGCPGMPPRHISCAFKPWNSVGDDPLDPLCMDAYWVGDECGDLVIYNWTDTYGLVYAGHCKPEGIGQPAGLAYHHDYIYVLDRSNRVIFRVVDCSGSLSEPIEIPNSLGNPSALTFYGGSLFVSDAGTEMVYEINDLGGIIEVHRLSDLSPRILSGMTFVGDLLFVASDDDEILVYEFGSLGFEVPEGDGVTVEPLMDELEIGFPTVADSGSLYVHVSGMDPCPPPEGVRFLPDFYEINVTASFDYIAEVAILTEDPPPEGINPRLVRIFRRPSGACVPYMDVTIAPFEIVETPRDPRLARLSKRLSEDDEFSVFILGEDRRSPMDVISLKYDYLQDAIDAVGGVPVDPVNLMNALKGDAVAATRAHRYGRAASLVDRIAHVAMATPEIPHTYHPDDPGGNPGGRIVARAHTLSFSLRQLMSEQRLVGPRPGPAFAMAPMAPGVSLCPNPSNAGFEIGFTPQGTGPLSLKIYSVDGRVVRTLIEDETLRGYRTVTWDSRNDAGMAVGPGTYFALLSQGGHSSVAKLILR